MLLPRSLSNCTATGKVQIRNLRLRDFTKSCGSDTGKFQGRIRIESASTQLLWTQQSANHMDTCWDIERVKCQTRYASAMSCACMLFMYRATEHLCNPSTNKHFLQSTWLWYFLVTTRNAYCFYSPYQYTVYYIARYKIIYKRKLHAPILCYAAAWTETILHRPMLFIISEVPVDTRWFSVAKAFQIFNSSIEVLLHHTWHWFWVEFHPDSLFEGVSVRHLVYVFVVMSHCSYMISRRDRCHRCRARVSY